VLAGEWLDGEKRASVPFLLAVIPFYNFLGLKFDQNSALIPLWALTTLTLVRSRKTRSAGYAALAGLFGAACVLSKYWSAFLLLALGLAVLCDPAATPIFARERRTSRRSSAWLRWRRTPSGSFSTHHVSRGGSSSCQRQSQLFSVRTKAND